MKNCNTTKQSRHKRKKRNRRKNILNSKLHHEDTIQKLCNTWLEFIFNSRKSIRVKPSIYQRQKRIEKIPKQHSKFKTAQYIQKPCVGGISDYVLMDKRCLCSEQITRARYARRQATDFIVKKN